MQRVVLTMMDIGGQRRLLPFDRRWWVASNMRTSMGLGAGSQFPSIHHRERLAEIGAVSSIGSVGDSYDNALTEIVIGYERLNSAVDPDKAIIQRTTLTGYSAEVLAHGAAPAVVWAKVRPERAKHWLDDERSVPGNDVGPLHGPL